MKTLLTLGTASILATLLSTTAVAATLNSKADAEIVAPVTLTEQATLNFGAFVPDAAGDTVTITAGALPLRSITTGLPVTSTISSGKFLIGGKTGLAVTIVLAVVNPLANGATTLTLSGLTSSLASPYTLDGTAADTIYVGGTLTIPPLAPAGLYTSASAYSVTVNYQ
ncbi:MAG: DUF4402 domain-containing protein [Chromatiales bacterium]|nr:DUF4402 domain-containing protein [Chromatiales bacterium]